MQEAGAEVLNQPVHAVGNVATAGNCLASAYLAAGVIARLDGLKAARSALHYGGAGGRKKRCTSTAPCRICCPACRRSPLRWDRRPWRGWQAV